MVGFTTTEAVRSVFLKPWFYSSIKQKLNTGFYPDEDLLGDKKVHASTTDLSLGMAPLKSYSL